MGKQMVATFNAKGEDKSSRCFIVHGKLHVGTNNSNSTSEVTGPELSVTTQTETERVLAGCSQTISDQHATAAQLCQ